MAEVTALEAREVFDSRGEPTVEATLATKNGSGVASVPSGASVGSHEALELRDHDAARYGGRGVLKAVAHVNETIAREVIGKDFTQSSLDQTLCALDGTANKSKLGANAILPVSIAFARAAAKEARQELYQYIGALDARATFIIPQPAFNILNGGKHAKGGIDLQECMLVPVACGTTRERVAATEKCVAALKSLLEQKGYETDLGDEGGFAPKLPSNDEALELLVLAIAGAGFTAGEIKIALDVAAGSFYKNGVYTLHEAGRERPVSEEQMTAWYKNAAQKYPIISIEDPFAEDAWDEFAALQQTLGSRVLVVGDDLLATNVERIALAAQKRAVSAAIIKPNQVGTVSEAVAAARAARAAGLKLFASHRSGETMDTFIADFAAGLSCEFIKAGAPTKPERMAKYNRLIEIEEHLKKTI